MNKQILKLAVKIGLLLKSKNLKLVTAESCTGGLVAAAITSIPGSSEYFDRGFVTYSNIAKHEILSVKSKTLKKNGSVSINTVKEMALGALHNSNAQISVAISGIAGPSGGSKTKPVGTVYFAFVGKNISLHTIRKNFLGQRDYIRNQSVSFTLRELIHFLSNSKA